MVRAALPIFCRRLTVAGDGFRNLAGPLLVVANHPNSFLDAILLAAQFRQPVHFLARGDAFHKPWHARLLRLLKMIPIYRMSEGKDNLLRNEYAFRRSTEVLQSGGIVLIFIEGICVNSHMLQPFKKGAGRIAIANRALPHFRIMPAALHYDSFNRFGKDIRLQLAAPLPVAAVLPFEDEARNIRFFNQTLRAVLSPMIHPAQTGLISGRNRFFLFGMLGWCLHAPLYYPLRNFVARKTAGTVFYDSVLFGVLLLTYPLYLLLWCTIPLVLGAALWFPVAAVILLPLLAWTAVRWKRA